FFFQAEDGIRDLIVTGVQTCALPIYRDSKKGKPGAEDVPIITQFYTPDWIVRSIVDNTLGYLWLCMHPGSQLPQFCKYYIKRPRSEERRVGKECRSRMWGRYRKKKTT